MAKSGVKNKNGNETWFKEWAVNTIDRIGMSGFLIICAVSIFIFWGTVDQKRKFIEKFILLNFKKEELSHSVVFIIFLLLAYIITLNYYQKRHKLQRQRIETLEQDLSDLKKLINK
ncbi:MAG: hypothetical protein JNL13_07805 [Chitinophagaceae bacterium]|nr:hypothetical protein [Chitinophagaceae bacterium]